MIYLSKKKKPSCAIVNGMQFLCKPLFFDLNDLERRSLALRISFQKPIQALRGKQLNMYGNIVNVSADVSSTISMLQLLPYETATIKVNLKWKLQ